METKKTTKQLVQLALWDELIQTLSFARDLSTAYHNSVESQRSDINELLNAVRTADVQSHIILGKIIDCFLTPAKNFEDHDDDNNALSDGELPDQKPQENIVLSVPYERRSGSPNCQLLIAPNECAIEEPQYRSRSPSQVQMASSEIKLRSNTKINYPSEAIGRSQSINLNRTPFNSPTPIQFRQFERSPSNSPTPAQFRQIKRSSSNSHIQVQSRQFNDSPINVHTSVQSKHLNWSPSNSRNPTQYTVSNRSRSKSQDQQQFDTRSMHSSVTRHSPKYRNHSRSPPRFRTQHGRRSRSHSRSYNEQGFDSKSTSSYKKKQSRMRKKSRSRSPNRKENVTKNQSFPKSNIEPPYSSSKSVKNNEKEYHRTSRSTTRKVTKTPMKKRTPKPKKEPEINAGIMMPPPPQDPYNVPRLYFHNPLNAPPMYCRPPRPPMPRLMRPPYFIPPRPRIPYPPAFPRMCRPPWLPMNPMMHNEEI
uniref:Uncharacterized protein n=1 Tax=Schizaphis graminum TaxID=13262 RepID=A0A2S2P6C6_SCHGA